MISYESFIGTRIHKLDAKSRLSIPAEMRTDLGNKFYITYGFDKNCLAVRPVESWNAFMEEINKLPKSVREMAHEQFNGHAEILSLDANGRFVLSEQLRSRIQAEPKSEVMILGSSDRIEIWNAPAKKAREAAADSVDWTTAWDEVE